jgi:hypothetical protein
MPGDAGGQRVIIERVEPEIDCGRFPIKRTVGERVVVEADVFADGQDALACRLFWRPESQSKWNEAPMEALPEDRWRAEFTPTEQGRWVYTVAGRAGSQSKIKAYRELAVWVERERARFSSWYEMVDGTLEEREARLPSVEAMGFDLLCLGPIDPGQDVRRLVTAAARRGIEIAVDISQSGEDLKGWIRQGVAAFRVPSPGDSPFPFWESLIAEVRREHPEVLFLAGALPRPKPARWLAKAGFSQSCVHLSWVRRASEIRQGFAELAKDRDFFRPSLWPNPPDQPALPVPAGGRPAFVQRLVLAATLGASYGLYQLHPWDLEPEDSVEELIGLVNRIRRQSPALQSDGSLRFHATDNDEVVCYSKAAGDNVLLIVVNLHPDLVHSAWLELDLGALGLEAGEPFQVHDLLTGARYRWHGSRNFVRLDPHQVPAHVFRVSRTAR